MCEGRADAKHPFCGSEGQQRGVFPPHLPSRHKHCFLESNCCKGAGPQLDHVQKAFWACKMESLQARVVTFFVRAGRGLTDLVQMSWAEPPLCGGKRPCLGDNARMLLASQRRGLRPRSYGGDL